MGDYCCKSSDKQASIGCGSHLKSFFSLLLFVKSGKFKTHFSTERVPSFGTPDLKWMRSVRCPDRNSQILTSPARHVSHDFTSLDFGSLGFSFSFIAVHQRCLTSPFLLDTCCTVPKHSFNHTHGDVVQSRGTLVTLLLIAEMQETFKSDMHCVILLSLKKSDSFNVWILIWWFQNLFYFACEFTWLFLSRYDSWQ